MEDNTEGEGRATTEEIGIKNTSPEASEKRFEARQKYNKEHERSAAHHVEKLEK
jgi:hypothetical protein